MDNDSRITETVVYLYTYSNDNHITHFYRIREEGGSGRPPTVHLRTDDVTWTSYTSYYRESSGDSDLV